MSIMEGHELSPAQYEEYEKTKAPYLIREKIWEMLNHEGGWTPEKVKDKKKFNAKTWRWGSVAVDIRDNMEFMNDKELVNLFWLVCRGYWRQM